jgi:hypothetical protein
MMPSASTTEKAALLSTTAAGAAAPEPSFDSLINGLDLTSSLIYAEKYSQTEMSGDERHLASDDSDHSPIAEDDSPSAPSPSTSSTSPVPERSSEASTGAVRVRSSQKKSRRRGNNPVKVERNRGACEKHRRDRKRCPLNCENRTPATTIRK